MGTGRARASRWLRPLLAAGSVAGLTVVLALSASAASGAFTATTDNQGNRVAAAIYFTCHNAARDIGAGGLTGSSPANRYYRLNESAGPTAADSSGSGASGTYYGGVTYGTTGPCPRDGAKAVTLNGSSGYIGTATAVPTPTTFSLKIWFRTTTTRGGMIMNLANQTSGTSTTAGGGADPDKGLYMTDTGRLAFSVRSGINAAAVSTSASFNDGSWHMATVTFSSTNGAHIYVDGNLAGSNAAITTSNSYTGYWRIGYDTVPGSWPFGPTSPYFSGSVAHASVHGVALTAQQVTAHYSAGI